MLEEIRKTLPSLCVNATRGAKSCSDQGCKVLFSKTFDPSLLVCVDCLQLPGGKRCDHLFFGRNKTDGNIWIVAVELKRGNPDISSVAKQLQRCAQFAEELVQKWRNAPLVFYPVLVHGGRLKKIESLPKGRPSTQVSFRGVKVNIVAKSNTLTLPRKGPT